MRARKNWYCSPSRPMGCWFDSVTDGIVGASVLMSVLLSVSGESHWLR